ncbi:glycine cleavage system protein GcvH [Clostridium sp. DJ247]|uniref:glycine cleavage system protein GcvH n=1 Tax=Clostridium sp. DJ247 TaxID=2726188 RepID=UPI00162A80D4|nr:glycine cleavage system protein GcvH [Clostridium sp. DJ247]MBC2578838.1 glycine cleavage system protein GcvH [Clostridium sp. DJ247]
MKVLDSLVYTEEHQWVKIQGDKAYIGITDFAQHSLGDIVFIELPEVDSEFLTGDTFGIIESVKAASDLYIPVGGKVVDINEELIDNPAAVNEDAYKNWMILIEITDKSELDELLDSQKYEDLCGKGE